MFKLKGDLKIQITRLFLFIARLVLGGIFIYSSVDKIAYPSVFSEIVINYSILPVSLAKFVAFTLPWVELILGIFIVVGFFIRESALFLSFLILIFMSVIIFKSLNGTIENCGCFLTSQQESNFNLFTFIIRDTFLLLFGGLLIFSKKIIKSKDILSGNYA